MKSTESESKGLEEHTLKNSLGGHELILYEFSFFFYLCDGGVILAPPFHAWSSGNIEMATQVSEATRYDKAGRLRIEQSVLLKCLSH